jgi:hypothetical protein
MSNSRPRLVKLPLAKGFLPSSPRISSRGRGERREVLEQQAVDEDEAASDLAQERQSHPCFRDSMSRRGVRSEMRSISRST